jgi:hypothetical protein
MDSQLPGISGIDALQRLRADPRTHAIPVIAVTASVMTQDTKRIMAAGFDGFQGKPLSMRELLATVREILDAGSLLSVGYAGGQVLASNPPGSQSQTCHCPGGCVCRNGEPVPAPIKNPGGVCIWFSGIGMAAVEWAQRFDQSSLTKRGRSCAQSL